jgi:hypothetical protein
MVPDRDRFMPVCVPMPVRAGREELGSINFSDSLSGALATMVAAQRFRTTGPTLISASKAELTEKKKLWEAIQELAARLRSKTVPACSICPWPEPKCTSNQNVHLTPEDFSFFKENIRQKDLPYCFPIKLTRVRVLGANQSIGITSTTSINCPCTCLHFR